MYAYIPISCTKILSRGHHSHNAYATICDCGQNALTEKYYHCGITIINFNAEVSLDCSILSRHSGLTVDYDEYFELTVDFCFDRGHRW